jgi:hypothetical protein
MCVLCSHDQYALSHTTSIIIIIIIIIIVIISQSICTFAHCSFGTNPNGYQERTSNYPAYSAAPTGMGDLLVDLIIVIAVVGALAGGFMGVSR